MQLIASLLEDHVKLALLEWQYERAYVWRRVRVLALAGVLGLATFVLTQVAVFHGLRMWGWSVWAASACLAVGNASLTLGLVWAFGRRDPRAGQPFQGTVEELNRNLKWIQNVFF